MWKDGPTVSVYDETGANLLATIDDAFPRITTDTSLFYQVPTTGIHTGSRATSRTACRRASARSSTRRAAASTAGTRRWW